MTKLMELTESKILNCTLMLSLLAHSGILAYFSLHNPHVLKETIRSIEITYQPVKPVDVKQETRMQSKPSSPNSDFRKMSSKVPEKTLVFKEEGPPLIKETEKLSPRLQMDKSRTVRMDARSVERKISVPELKSEKINNPVYLDYYQIVRNRIKDRAYRNYSRTDSGEVYLTFVLTSDGSLKQIKLVDSKTSAGAYLKDIGLKSIRESSPFPSFPSNLKYPELSFNVVISFEVKN